MNFILILTVFTLSSTIDQLLRKTKKPHSFTVEKLCPCHLRQVTGVYIPSNKTLTSHGP